jgi:CRP/FNR family transcriptional regulator
MSGPVTLDGFGEQAGIELVQRLPLFGTLTFEETRRLFAAARLETRPAGQVIVEENAVGQALYIVKRGRVRVERGGAVLGRLEEGGLFGEMSLVDDLLTSAQVVADGPGEVELVVLPRRPFEALLASDPALAVKVYQAFCRTLTERLRRANDLLPADQRVAHGVK